MRTLIVSDVHLGSNLCRATELLALLNTETFDRLLLLGDIFDDLNFNRLKKPHWKVLSKLRKLSDSAEVVWVEGNHDLELDTIVSAFLGVKIYQRYEWQEGGQKFLAMHGHQFDEFIRKHPIVTEVACRIYALVQSVFFGRYIARFLKRNAKQYLRASDLIAQRASTYAKRLGASHMFCGHTHKAEHKVIDDVHYWNDGCWTDSPATYIAVEDGEVSLHEVE